MSARNTLVASSSDSVQGSVSILAGEAWRPFVSDVAGELSGSISRPKADYWPYTHEHSRYGFRGQLFDPFAGSQTSVPAVPPADDLTPGKEAHRHKKEGHPAHKRRYVLGYAWQMQYVKVRMAGNGSCAHHAAA